MSVKERIIALVKENWDQRGLPLLLSAIGARLNQEFGKDVVARETYGAKLRPFIEANFDGAIRVVQHPKNPIVFGAIPVSAEFKSTEELFARPKKAFTSTDGETSPQDHVSYNKTIWSAFVTPLGSNVCRYLKVGETVEFLELSMSAAPPVGYYRITATDLPPEAEKNFPTISKAIEHWSKTHGVDLTNHKKTRRTHSKSLLELLFDTLSSEEMENISISLQVAQKLASRRV